MPVPTRYSTGKTIRISDEVWNVLNRMGYTSDSFDDVLKGILKQFRDSNTISETNREIIDKCLKEITPENINQEITKLLEEGIIYEPRPGRVRYLG